jgi:hypothetical protein
VFDCADGLGFAEWANLGKIRDNVVEENVFVGTRPDQHAVSLRNFIGPSLEAGTFGRNTYVNLTTTTLFFYETKQVPQNRQAALAPAPVAKADRAGCRQPRRFGRHRLGPDPHGQVAGQRFG